MLLKRGLTLITILILGTQLIACTNIGLKFVNLPAKAFRGETHKNLVYDQTTENKLDIYVPHQAKKNHLPVIIFFHGGSWKNGKKDDYPFVATRLAAKGFIVVVPDYQKYPQVKFPTFIEDGAKAVQWTRENIIDYKGKPDSLFLAGHSAGAHLGAMLVSNKAYLNQLGDSFTNIKGFAGLAGPYSFTPKTPDLQDIFGPPSRYPLMQVPNFINGSEPPMLLLHGKKDETVFLSNLEKLEAEILKKQGKVNVTLYPNLDHTEIIAVFSPFLSFRAPVLNDVSDFFIEQDHLQPK